MIYVSTACLGERQFERDVFKVLNVYEKLGIKNVELGSVHSPVKDLGKLKKYDFNYIIHAYFPADSQDAFFLNFGTDNEKTLKRSMAIAKKAIVLLNDLGGDHYSVHPGFSAEGMKYLIPVKKAYDNCVRNLGVLKDFADEHSVKLSVENMQANQPNLLMRTDEEIKFVLDKVKCGLLLDLGHMDITCYEHGLERVEFVKKVKKYISELHVHRVFKSADHLPLIDSAVFKGFDKEFLKRKYVTLESNGLGSSGILESKKIISDFLS